MEYSKFVLVIKTLEAVHRRRPQTGGVVQWGQFSDKGVFRCKHPHFSHFGVNIFRNLWCVCLDKEGGGLSLCGQFVEKREGGQFFEERHLLLMVPYSRA